MKDDANTLEEFGHVLAKVAERQAHGLSTVAYSTSALNNVAAGAFAIAAQLCRANDLKEKCQGVRVEEELGRGTCLPVDVEILEEL